MRDVFLHHPQPIVGTSGALLYVTDHVTVKVATQKAAQKVRDRLNAQSAWLVDHKCECLPKVYAKWNGGYAMETLYSLPKTDAVQRLRLLEIVRTRLHHHVWPDPMHGTQWGVSGTVLMGHHREYVHDLLRDWAPSLIPKMLGWMKGIASLNLTGANTHGDPTLDNLMRREDGTWVLTDPIPGSPRVPKLLAVDLGKMLQSVYGYEDIKAGLQPDVMFTLGIETVLGGFTPSDQAAAKYFLAVHVLRLIPYQKADVRDRFLSQLETIVMQGVA